MFSVDESVVTTFKWPFFRRKKGRRKERWDFRTLRGKVPELFGPLFFRRE